MSGALERLNLAPAEIAEADFTNCCGSLSWARAMTAARPFGDVKDLLKRAERIWENLDVQDWLEAFAAHPKIGEKKDAVKRPKRFAEWSRSEQSGVERTADSVLAELEECNSLYERRFGYIFIVCATGKSAAEMLEICCRRLNNDAETELRIAADEQRKITEIRLKKLLQTEN